MIRSTFAKLPLAAALAGFGACLSVLPLPAAGASQPPSVSFKAPAAGAVLSGRVGGSACEALAADDRGVAQVRFFLDGTALNTEASAPWQCELDTEKFADGSHTLRALAVDEEGQTSAAQVGIQIRNRGAAAESAPAREPATRSSGAPAARTTPAPLPAGPRQTAPAALSSADVKAVATFESLGLTWKPGSSPGAAGCTVRYRKAGESAWRQGHPLWYDTRDSRCRGSLVHLAPGTTYDVQLGLPGKAPSAQVSAATWSERFPVERTVRLPGGTMYRQLDITEGGGEDGYVVYTAGPGGTTIDGRNATPYNIHVNASKVIIRGLTLTRAQIDAIRIAPGAKDVVIEDNDISEWGRYSHTNKEGWKIGVNADAGIKADCGRTPDVERIVIQRNRIHHPRFGSNSWSEGHPSGPNGILFWQCGGNHVIRHNELYSEPGRYFMDAIGGGENFSKLGFPNKDSDIYGNRIQHAWDDGIEAEGANENVRIWANYIDSTATGVATTATAVGPVYIFRNVYNRSRMLSQAEADEDDRNTFFKSGNSGRYGDGRRYVYHNTMLQAPPENGGRLPLGGGSGIKGNRNQPMTNTVTRNNIFHVWQSHAQAIEQKDGGGNNDFDYDLYNGSVAAYPGAERNGIVGTPTYAPGHGALSEDGGHYQLSPRSYGYDKGVRLPNFNDDFKGAAPDIGAHEAGSPALRFGTRR